MISSEAFFSYPDKERLCELRDSFHKYDIKIICYLRRQDLFIESSYNQKVKVGSNISLEDLIKTMKTLTENGFSLSTTELKFFFERWMFNINESSESSFLTIGQRKYILDKYRNSNNAIARQFIPETGLDYLFTENLDHYNDTNQDPALCSGEVISLLMEIVYKQGEAIDKHRELVDMKDLKP